MSESAPTALVTGAGGGIGEMVSDELLCRGYAITAIDRRFLSESKSARLTRHVGSVSDWEWCQKVVGNIDQLDVLVNVAAIRPTGSVSDMDIEIWRECLDVNLTGAFIMMRACLPKMSRNGSIVNVSSAAAFGKRDLCAYGASKAGLISLTKTAALDLSALNIRVNAVLPGSTHTPMFVAAGADSTAPASRNIGGYPLSARAVAECIVRVAEDEWLSGAVIPAGLLPAEW